MTAEETQQVQAYIFTLQAQHTAAMRVLQAQHSFQLQGETNVRKVAQQDSLKMGRALGHIWDYSLANPTMPPEQFMLCVRQMMDYYAPDFDIPF